MTFKKTALVLAAVAAAATAAGCSADGNLATAAIAPKADVKPVVDPACAALTSQIDALRKEGAPERLEKAAEGKAGTVKVKRDTLVKQAELNRVFADYQAKCGPRIPTQTAQVPPATVTPAPAEKAQ